eukprot:4627266-Amphidinium_carterae.1
MVVTLVSAANLHLVGASCKRADREDSWPSCTLLAQTTKYVCICADQVACQDGLAKSGLKEIPQDLQAVMEVLPIMGATQIGNAHIGCHLTVLLDVVVPLCEAVDSDASGAIDYTEFIAAMMRTTFLFAL